MKVYIVIKWDHDETEFIGVFKDKHVAECVVEGLNRLGIYITSDGHVVKWESHDFIEEDLL
jgi:hypothetical protein